MNAPLPPSGSEPGRPRSARDWEQHSGLGPELARAIRARVQRRRRRAIALGATTFGLVVAIGLAWLPRTADATKPPTLARAESSAAVLVPERQTLADGSIVELRPGAAVRTEFTANERRVTLIQGEAHFQVAKNPQRPFIVSAQGVEVRAVGTAFSVGLGQAPGAVEVLVTEGVVSLNSPAVGIPAPSQPAANAGRMTAGQRAVISATSPAAPSVQAVTPTQLAQRLAWRVPRLQFSGTPLDEVVALFREHGGVRLSLGDPALAAVRVSGVLRANNTTALLRLLAADHDIAPEQRGDEIVLRRAR